MSTNIEAFPAQRVIRGVTVVYAIELLDFLYPGGWTQLYPCHYQRATAGWMHENDAHYFSWIGAACERQTKEDAAIDRAKMAGKRIVLIDSLYRSIRSG